MSVAESFVTVRPDMDGFGGEMRRGLGGFMSIARTGGLAIGAALVGAGTAAVNIGRSFEDAQNTIRVGTGEVGDSLDGLMDDFRAVAREVPADFEDISGAIADLNTRLGLTGEPLQDLAGQFLELSRITGDDVTGSIESVTRAFGDWDVEDEADTLDMLFRASQATGIGVNDLARQLVQFGAPLRSMGFGLEESTALLASFEREGVNAELVMGSLRIALGNFAREGVQDTRGAFEELVGNIQEAGSSGEAAALAIEVFGARAGPDMAAAIREGRLSIEDLLDVIESGDETILGAAEDTRTLTESWQTFKNNAMLALEPIAERVLGALSEGMDRLAAWWQDNGPAIEARIEELGEALSAWWNDTARPAIEGFAALIEEHWPRIESIIERLGGLVEAQRDLFALGFGGAADEVEDASGRQQGDLSDLSDAFGALLTAAEIAVEGQSRLVRTFTAELTIRSGIIRRDLGQVGEGVQLLSDTWGLNLDGMVISMGQWAAQVERKIDNVVGWFRDLPGRIRDALAGLGADLRGIASDAMRQFGAGLTGGLTLALPDVRGGMGRLTDTIRGFLPSSPADEGAFSGQGAPELLGRRLVSEFARGFASEDLAGQVRHAAADMHAALAVPTIQTQARGSDGVHIEHLTIGSRDDLTETRFAMSKAAAQVAYG
jgi:TP901 family phage tail tape measure protein